MRSELVWPMIAMVALVFITWCRLYFERISELRHRRIPPQSIATRAAAAQTMQVTRASDHFSNLFEIPVLFFALCLSLIATGEQHPLFLVGAWVFVALRAGHALIHLTYNRVLHRFYAFVASSVVLFLLWGIFAVRLAMR